MLISNKVNKVSVETITYIEKLEVQQPLTIKNKKKIAFSDLNLFLNIAGNPTQFFVRVG